MLVAEADQGAAPCGSGPSSSPPRSSLAPLGARAADLVVWWDKGYYPEENEALTELIRAFEAKAGLKVELVLHDDLDVTKPIKEAIGDAIATGRPPDFMFSLQQTQGQLERWAAENRLIDLTDVVGALADLFDPDLLDLGMATDSTGRRGLYALPVGRVTNHVHVWLSLLERAGFRREDIPAEWEPFWSFWCDTVQPAVRKALGRQDVWAVGAPMSAAVIDTGRGVAQFVYAYTEAWPTLTGPSLLRDPAARAALVKGLAGYTALWREGCTPPDALGWTNRGNNDAFLAQRVVMTVNATLSIPSALKATRAGRLLPQRDHDRLAEGRVRAARACRRPGLPGGGLQGRRAHGSGQAVRALPGRGRLARDLPDERRRPHPAAVAGGCSSSPSGSTRATRTGCRR